MSAATVGVRADVLLRHADEPWIDCATRAVRELAGRGQDFTADDVTALGVPDPDHPSRWGSLFAAAKRDGIISPVGYVASSRPSRNGGVTRVWRGTVETIQVTCAGCGRVLVASPDDEALIAMEGWYEDPEDRTWCGGCDAYDDQSVAS